MPIQRKKGPEAILSQVGNLLKQFHIPSLQTQGQFKKFLFPTSVIHFYLPLLMFIWLQRKTPKRHHIFWNFKLEKRKWKTVGLDLISNLIHVVLQHFPRKIKQDEISDEQASFTVHMHCNTDLFQWRRSPTCRILVGFTTLKTTGCRTNE